MPRVDSKGTRLDRNGEPLIKIVDTWQLQKRVIKLEEEIEKLKAKISQ